MTFNSDADFSKLKRRSFLAGITAGAGVATGLGAALIVDPLQAQTQFDSTTSSIASLGQLTPESEEYWLAVKKLFRLRPGLIALNAANLCPSSKPVSSMLFEGTDDIDSDPSFENRAKYTSSKEHTRQLLATMLGATTDEIAITRNTSESNRTVIGGLELKPGDEVLLWDQNHESNNIAWDVWSRRLGFSVKRVSTPESPEDSAQLLQPFVDAMGPRTKIVSFSHVSNTSGIALPAHDLCTTIRAHGALSLCDGAQTFGMAVQDLNKLGCDFYTGSSHKWLCGPRETGVLYVRSDAQESLWPPMVTHDWEKEGHLGARKFDNLGQRDDGRLDALGTALDFYNTLGGHRVEARIRSHVARLMAGLNPLADRLQFLTPSKQQLQGGIVIFLYNGKKAQPTMETLYQNYGISAAAADLGQHTWVRLSPHIYNTPREIDTAITAIHQLVAA